MVLERFSWMEAVSHPQVDVYLKWVNGEVNRHVRSAPIQGKLLQITESIYAAEEGASEERQKLFEKMSTQVQQLAAQHAGVH